MISTQFKVWRYQELHVCPGLSEALPAGLKHNRLISGQCCSHCLKKQHQSKFITIRRTNDLQPLRCFEICKHQGKEKAVKCSCSSRLLEMGCKKRRRNHVRVLIGKAEKPSWEKMETRLHLCWNRNVGSTAWWGAKNVDLLCIWQQHKFWGPGTWFLLWVGGLHMDSAYNWVFEWLLYQI